MTATDEEAISFSLLPHGDEMLQPTVGQALFATRWYGILSFMAGGRTGTGIPSMAFWNRKGIQIELT